MPLNDELHVAALLQRYYEGGCAAEERAYIEGNAELLARVAALRREDDALRQLFAEATYAPTSADDWPTPEDLIAYVDSTITEARRRFVEDCARRCPAVQEEIRLLRRLGSDLLRPQ